MASMGITLDNLECILEYRGFDNVAVIPTFTSTLCRQFCEDRKKELKLQKENSKNAEAASKNRWNTYKAVLRSIP